jgi:hypothetical protein
MSLSKRNPTGYESYSDADLRTFIHEVLERSGSSDHRILDSEIIRDIERRDPQLAALHKAQTAVIEADDRARAEAKGAPLTFGDINTLDSFLPDTDDKLAEAQARHRERLAAWINPASA